MLQRSSETAYKKAKSLEFDPSNEVLVRLFHKGTEESVFRNGYSSEFFGDGEGSMYGEGVYCFYDPKGNKRYEGAEARYGGHLIGNYLMKCALIGGLKNFVIFNKEKSLQYYGTDSIEKQLKIIFQDDNLVSKMMKTVNGIMRSINGTHPMGWSAPIARYLFGKEGNPEFKKELRKRGIRGLAYYGKNDRYALVCYDPRSIIPLAITDKESYLANKWTYYASEESIDKVNNVKDAKFYLDPLKVRGEITGYQNTPIQNELGLVEKNGTFNYYNIVTKRYVSNKWFDFATNFENNTSTVQIGNELFSIKKDNDIYIAEDKKTKRKFKLPEFKPYIYEKSYKERLSDFIKGAVYGYHKTETVEELESIFKYGFNREYNNKNGNVYGSGAYGVLSLQYSNSNLNHYGKYTIRYAIKNGLKNFLIFEPEIAKKIYKDKWSLDDQLNLLIDRDTYNRLYKKYGSALDTYLHSIRIADKLKGDIYSTKIRGIVYNGVFVLAFNFNDTIPLSYSTDGGLTWKQKVSENLLNFLEKTSDVAYTVSNKVNKNGEKKFNNTASHVVNGHVLVEKKGKFNLFSISLNKEISKVDFDTLTDFNDEGIATAELNGSEYYITDNHDGTYTISDEWDDEVDLSEFKL